MMMDAGADTVACGGAYRTQVLRCMEGSESDSGLEVLSLLLEKQTQQECREVEEGSSALRLAVSRGHNLAAYLLLENGALADLCNYQG